MITLTLIGVLLCIGSVYLIIITIAYDSGMSSEQQARMDKVHAYDMSHKDTHITMVCRYNTPTKGSTRFITTTNKDYACSVVKRGA